MVLNAEHLKWFALCKGNWDKPQSMAENELPTTVQ